MYKYIHIVKLLCLYTICMCLHTIYTVNVISWQECSHHSNYELPTSTTNIVYFADRPVHNTWRSEVMGLGGQSWWRICYKGNEPRKLRKAGVRLRSEPYSSSCHVYMTHLCHIFNPLFVCTLGNNLHVSLQQHCVPLIGNSGCSKISVVAKVSETKSHELFSASDS